MKLTIERTALLRSLNHVQSVVARRPPIPLLSEVPVVAGDNYLAWPATDLDRAVID